ncbi:hypothetical protein [Nannocystis pusilla]|uniref:hypothetical protein n=1 Tax=Nannocystis pusilla TaxID=889268 RepID=UPI003DA23BA9
MVFGAGEPRTIDLRGEADSGHKEWALTADGRTLTVQVWSRGSGSPGPVSLRLWDLTQADAPPRSIPLPQGVWPAVADDASTVAFADGDATRVIRPRNGGEARLRYVGRPFALTGDARFAIASPNDDDDGKLNVVDLETGTSRRVEAGWGTPVGEGDALFMRREYGHEALWRESLATGEVVWRMQVPSHGGRVDRRVLVEPGGDHFAVAIGEDWAVGDLRIGGLRSFMTVPKDRMPQWGPEGTLLVVHRHEVRIHRPQAAALTVHERGPGCALAPAARWAAATPWDRSRGEFTRVELATGATATFRCPNPPAAGSDMDAMWGLNAFVDDAGQVAVIGEEGWNCWWDEQHGARVGALPLTGWVVELPRGVARAVEAEVEVWTGPDQRAQRFTAAAKVVDLRASPSGRLLAVRSEKGVELLAVDSGAVTPVVTEASPLGSGELMAGALAWSPDSAQLAVLKPLAGSLELTRWDVSGRPRELERRVLKDSPGRPRNLLAFTPSGESLVLTANHESLMRVVGPTITLQTATPVLAAFTMRDENEAVGIDFQGGPFMIGIMEGGMTPLTPNPDLGSSTNPPIRRAADGTVWACDALGPGTLLRWAPFAAETPEAVRERIAGLAAAL